MKGINLKHGYTVGGKKCYPPEYRAWMAAKNRCTNPNNDAYKDYGGRGINMCIRWSESFVAFLEDVGLRPQGHSLDRINNDGNYEPGNCRWSTRKQQSINQRPRKFTKANVAAIRASGLKQSELAQAYSVAPSCISNIRSGKSHQDVALST